MTINRQQCIVNEKKDEIVKNFDELKSKYGSVLRGAKFKSEKNPVPLLNPILNPKNKRSQKRRLRLPTMVVFCHTLWNLSITYLLISLNNFHCIFLVRVLCRTSELKLLADETEDILYHTSSVSETLDTLLSFKKRLSEINGYSDIEEEDVEDTPAAVGKRQELDHRY